LRLYFISVMAKGMTTPLASAPRPAASHLSPLASYRVAVLGGGWAGMAAAATLAQARMPVTVYEAARTLGGRARRVEVNGLALDNGLHILIGAYRECLRLIEMVSAPASLESGLSRLPLDLHFPGKFRLRAPALPAPLHLAVALLLAKGLKFTDRIRAALFMTQLRAMQFTLEQDISVDALLSRFHQSAGARRYLWEPLCISALNTRPEDASAQVFLNVLRDSLHGTRKDSELLLPIRDLSALFPEPAGRFVEGAGGKVRIGTPVRSVQESAGRFLVRTPVGEEHFTHIVCALPPYRVGDALSGIPALAGMRDMIGQLHHEPICSVYLQYPPHTRLPQAMLGLEGGAAQWVFDRGQLFAQNGLLGVVISAHRRHEAVDQEQLCAHVRAELLAAFPDLPAPLWTKVIEERRATFACTVGVKRPAQRTPVANLYLAGDYTNSPYPATLESAVCSGVACARMVLESIS
jgi:squalene-associated FAD-dependent desaturase